MITPEAMAKAIDEMATTLKFFPAKATAIGRILTEMASSDAEILWLARRLPQLYNEWPGALEMRAVFCSRFRPRDGVEAYSTDQRFADEGIPSEKAAMALPASPMLALPAGRAVSVAETVDVAVCDLARAKDLNRQGPPPRVRDIPVLPPGANPITEADLRKVEEELRQKRAKDELAPRASAPEAA